jgi:hypothetical protein
MTINSNGLLDTELAAKFLGCTKRKLESDRIKGGGVTYIKIGRCVRYDPRDLEAYIEKNKMNSTSQVRK